MSQKRCIYKVNIPYYNVYTSFWDTLYISGDFRKHITQLCLMDDIYLKVASTFIYKAFYHRPTF
jgi:hypothetical protein